MFLWNHYPLNFTPKKARDMPTHIASRLIDAASQIILGKEHAVRLALACMLARGHLLMEDMPGVGKTTLAHALAHLLGLRFQRIQFTSDMLPADILGVSVFDSREGAFRFHPGPVFSEMILADEINRATPKAQSALLEAMEERQISAEGRTYPLPASFFVIATQNPTDQIGTFPLPESQLDRFLMRISLGYPDPASERALLAGEDRRNMLARLPPVLAAGELDTLLAATRQIHVGPRLLTFRGTIAPVDRQPVTTPVDELAQRRGGASPVLRRPPLGQQPLDLGRSEEELRRRTADHLGGRRVGLHQEWRSGQAWVFSLRINPEALS